MIFFKPTTSASERWVSPKNENDLLTLKYFQTCMNVFVLQNTKEDILKNVENRADLRHFHNIYFPTMEVNGAPKQPAYKLSSAYLPLCSAEQRHSHRFGTTGWVNHFHFRGNYPSNHTLYFYINWIGPRMILKEYSAVAVVTKRVHIWLTDKLHTLIAVLFFILWILITFSWTTLFQVKDSGCCIKSCCITECHLHSLP